MEINAGARLKAAQPVGQSLHSDMDTASVNACVRLISAKAYHITKQIPE